MRPSDFVTALVLIVGSTAATIIIQYVAALVVLHSCC